MQVLPKYQHDLLVRPARSQVFDKSSKFVISVNSWIAASVREEKGDFRALRNFQFYG